MVPAYVKHPIFLFHRLECIENMFASACVIGMCTEPLCISVSMGHDRPYNKQELAINGPGKIIEGFPQLSSFGKPGGNENVVTTQCLRFFSKLHVAFPCQFHVIVVCKNQPPVLEYEFHSKGIVCHQNQFIAI